MTDDRDPVVEGQVVPGNRWDLLDVPELGSWRPTRRVSVVLPYYQAPDALEITLAALAEQTYPAELLQVVVADDGSNPPLELPDGHRGLDLVVVNQEDRGFGLARARNTGAKAADGDILIFVDCDMVPEPWHVEAHARWHHACQHAVTLGFRRHVEFDGIGPDEVSRAAADGGLAPLFEGRDQQVPDWIDGHMLRTADLTGPHDDLFRAVTGGNLGVRAETYWAVGGSDESFTQWGAEDTELGYRFFVDGALLVPARDALCWHQGHGHVPEPHEQVSLEQQRAKLAHLIAHHGFRRARPGRSFAVPRVVVEVEAGDVGRELVVDTVESVLSSDLHDLHVVLHLDAGHPAGVQLERDLGGDPRVSVGPGVRPQHVPFVLTLPAGATVATDTVSRLVRQLSDPEDPVGVLRVTVPDRRPRDAAATMVRGRALGRARHLVDAQADDLLAQAGELFGQRWITGLDVGMTWAGQEALAAAAAAGEPAPASVQPATSEVAQLQELWDAFGQLEPIQRRAVLRIAKRVLGASPRQRALLVRLASRAVALGQAFGALGRIRRLGDVRRAGGAMARAVLPHRAVVAMRERAGAPEEATPTDDEAAVARLPDVPGSKSAGTASG